MEKLYKIINIQIQGTEQTLKKISVYDHIISLSELISTTRIQGVVIQDIVMSVCEKEK